MYGHLDGPRQLLGGNDTTRSGHSTVRSLLVSLLCEVFSRCLSSKRLSGNFKNMGILSTIKTLTSLKFDNYQEEQEMEMGGWLEKRRFLTTIQEEQWSLQPLWKTVRRYLQKLNKELSYDPTIPPLGIYPDKTSIEKNTCTHMFTTALFTVAKTWKLPKRPLTDEWIGKMWYIYTVEYYSAIKKNEVMPCAATWMDLEILI